MKIGLRLIEFLGSPRELVELTVLGEEAGFDSVWYPHDTFMQSTLALTTAAAEATSRVNLGGVGISPYHLNPCEIATYMATLDSLSEGRALLGLGFHTQEFTRWTGIETEDYLTRTKEAAEIIRALFRGEVVEYDGDEFQWNDQCYFRFTPYRDRIPIYICPFGEDYLELSGAVGDGSLPMITPPASARHMVGSIHKGARDAGRAVADVEISGCGWLSISEDQTAAARIMRNMVAYFGPHLEEHALAAIGLSRAQMSPLKALIEQRKYDEAHELVTEDMLQLGIVGTPEEVIAEIEKLADAGVTEVNLGGPPGSRPERGNHPDG